MPMDSFFSITLVLRIAIPGLYFIVAVGYIKQFLDLSKKLPPWVKPSLYTGLLLHIVLFGLLYSKRGTIPLFTVFEGLLACSLILSVLCIIMEYILNETCYGAFLQPVNSVISLIASIYLFTGKPLPDSMTSPYYIFHVMVLSAAYACFFLSCIIAIMYLLQYNEIKNRHLGYLFKRLPALENMDISIARIDALGLILFCVGIVIGFLWLDIASDNPYRMNLKIGFSSLTALVYLIEHVLRITQGWKGQRTAMISIFGFIFVLINLLIGRHGY
jgi:ABC-type transport system involved in cytochrome c biogenesis permease subunit